jgi:hypothetical protein
VRKVCATGIAKSEGYRDIQVRDTQVQLYAWRTHPTMRGEKLWIVDSGATDHMSPHRHLFSTLVLEEGWVNIANGEKVRCLGHGNIGVTFQDKHGDRNFTLTKVLYVPALDANLFSIPKISKKGMTSKMDKRGITISSKEGKTLVVGPLLGRTYMLESKSRIPTGRSARGTTNWEVWHKRLGHLNEQDMRKIIPVEGKTKPRRKCETCCQGKIKTLSFEKASTNRRCDTLALVHSDVMGPLDTPSRGGNRYVVRFVDDRTR